MESHSRFCHECDEPIAASQALALARAKSSRMSLSNPSLQLQIHDLQMRNSANIAEHAAIATENDKLVQQVEKMNECLSGPTREFVTKILWIQQSNTSFTWGRKHPPPPNDGCKWEGGDVPDEGSH